MSIATVYTNYAAVTPNDTTVIPHTAGLYVGGAGNLTVIGPNGATVVFEAVAAGTVLEIEVITVKATGTTATFIVSLR